MNEVGGAVQWVDDPDMVSLGIAMRRRRLLAAHRMVRTGGKHAWIPFGFVDAFRPPFDIQVDMIRLHQFGQGGNALYLVLEVISTIQDIHPLAALAVALSEYLSGVGLADFTSLFIILDRVPHHMEGRLVINNSIILSFGLL